MKDLAYSVVFVVLYTYTYYLSTTILPTYMAWALAEHVFPPMLRQEFRPIQKFDVYKWAVEGPYVVMNLRLKIFEEFVLVEHNL